MTAFPTSPHQQVAEPRLIMEVVVSLVMPQLRAADLLQAKTFLKDLFLFAGCDPDEDASIVKNTRLSEIVHQVRLNVDRI